VIEGRAAPQGLGNNSSRTDERDRVVASLAVLHRMRDEATARNRPAMLHSVMQLIKLQTGALRQLQHALPAKGEAPLTAAADKPYED
jgi:hypothetical protein